MSGKVQLIVNADDFGLSTGVNRGIIRGFRDGIVTSTTMLVNQPGFDEAVSLAREHPDLGLGIHLTLLWGRPVSPPDSVRSLTMGDGNLPDGLSTLARRYFLGSLSMDEVRRELRAQIEKFRSTGLEPTHADTHKHVHCLPGVRRALMQVLDEMGIRRMRVPYEDKPDNPESSKLRRSWVDLGKTRLIRYFFRDARSELSRTGLKTTDHFVGISYMSCLDEQSLGAILRGLGDGVTEIMCHPGQDDGQPDTFSRKSLRRERELAGLTARTVTDTVRDRGIRLISYREL